MRAGQYRASTVPIISRTRVLQQRIMHVWPTWRSGAMDCSDEREASRGPLHSLLEKVNPLPPPIDCGLLRSAALYRSPLGVPGTDLRVCGDW